jgi:hypothetical protein
MAASAWLVHDAIKEYFGNGVIDLDTNTFKMILAVDGSNLHTPATNAYSTVTSEVAEASGYLTGGKAVTNPVWVAVTGTGVFDCDDVVWTAVTGSITSRYAGLVITDISSPVTAPVLCSSLLDTTPDDVVATAGNTFTVQIHVDGVFSLS